MKNFKKLCGALLITAGIMTPSAQAGYFSWGKDSAVVTAAVVVTGLAVAYIYNYMNRTQEELGIDSTCNENDNKNELDESKNDKTDDKGKDELVVVKKPTRLNPADMVNQAQQRFGKLVEDNKDKSEKRPIIRRPMGPKGRRTPESVRKLSTRINEIHDKTVKKYEEQQQKKKTVRRRVPIFGTAVQNELEKTLNQRNQQQK